MIQVRFFSHDSVLPLYCRQPSAGPVHLGPPWPVHLGPPWGECCVLPCAERVLSSGTGRACSVPHGRFVTVLPAAWQCRASAPGASAGAHASAFCMQCALRPQHSLARWAHCCSDPVVLRFTQGLSTLEPGLLVIQGIGDQIPYCDGCRVLTDTKPPDGGRKQSAGEARKLQSSGPGRARRALVKVWAAAGSVRGGKLQAAWGAWGRE